MKPSTTISAALLFGAMLPLLGACDAAEVKQCREQYMEAYALVTAVDTTKLESVQPALDKVTATKEICDKTALAEERKQLHTAQRKLESHRAYLEQQANLKKLTPEEIASLAKTGDPFCPQGTGYKVNDGQEQIRCTGPQLIDMNWKEASEYFKRRGFKLTSAASELKAESGSVSYAYRFAKEGDTSRASCVIIFSPPGIAWEETASRVSGVLPQRIKRDQPLKTNTGEYALAVEEQEIQAVLRIGQCN